MNHTYTHTHARTHLDGFWLGCILLFNWSPIHRHVPIDKWHWNSIIWLRARCLFAIRDVKCVVMHWSHRAIRKARSRFFSECEKKSNCALDSNKRVETISQRKTTLTARRSIYCERTQQKKNGEQQQQKCKRHNEMCTQHTRKQIEPNYV